jgi:hypothetical protein
LTKAGVKENGVGWLRSEWWLRKISIKIGIKSYKSLNLFWGATALSITTFSIMALNIMDLVTTLSINDNQHRYSA